MKQFKGTKGKWKICESELKGVDKEKSVVIFSEERKKTGISGYPYAMVCAISPLSMFNKEDEANAKLIAAAPELLEALQEVVQGMIILGKSDPDHVGIKKDIELAQQAINKALN